MYFIRLCILFILLISSAFSNNNVSIFLDKDADDIKKFAANELQKHLELILNKKITISNKLSSKGKYQFIIGKVPSFYKNKLSHEESNYYIDNKKIFIWGEDKIIKQFNSSKETALYMRNRVGTLFSVYDFLFNELKIRWVSPGDKGIVFSTQNNLNLEEKKFHWKPFFKFRVFRNDTWKYEKFIKKYNMHKFTPEELILDKKNVYIMSMSMNLWKRRLKLGISEKPKYGHAFTKYWDIYGEKNPEWFSLGMNNKRGLLGHPKIKKTHQKFCSTNNNLQNRIIKNWEIEYLSKGLNTYNASVNDSRGYCTCDICSLFNNDSNSKSDLYVNFWNRLLVNAKKFNKNAKVIAYIYNEYRKPPLSLNVNKNIILGFVPMFSDLPEETSLDLVNWKKKGLNEVFLRPNDFNDDIGMPMGHEEYIVKKFNIFKNSNLLGLDYDKNYNFSNLAFESITYYILSQLISNPNRNFNEIEDEYYSSFGNAKNEIKSFYLYWRKNFEIKRLKDIKKAAGFEGRRYLYKNISKYYEKVDFDLTNRFLDKALIKIKDPMIKLRVENIKIANKHSYLLYTALNNKLSLKDYKNLILYRIKFKKSLKLPWPLIFYIEYKLTDLNFFNTFPSKILESIESKL